MRKVGLPGALLGFAGADVGTCRSCTALIRIRFHFHPLLNATSAAPAGTRRPAPQKHPLARCGPRTGCDQREHPVRSGRRHFFLLLTCDCASAPPSQSRSAAPGRSVPVRRCARSRCDSAAGLREISPAAPAVLRRSLSLGFCPFPPPPGQTGTLRKQRDSRRR